MSDGGYSRYKVIRNDIRKFDPEKLVFLTIDHLNHISETSIEEWATKGKSPWELLLLVKWALYEAKDASKKIPSSRDFSRIVNKIKDFNDDLGVPEKSNFKIEKFMRKMAFQQFWLQSGQSLCSMRLGRTIELFLKMECKYDVDELLVKEIGLNRNEFFDFSFITWIKMNGQNNPEDRFLTTNFFSTIKGIKQEKLIKYFECISVDWERAKDIATDSSNKGSFEFQKFEQSSFKKFPFLRTNKGLLAFCPIVFTDYLENFFYDFAKLKSKGAFNDHFGAVFEKYVGKGVKLLDSKFLKESEIRQRFGNKKTVDFYIENEKGNLLIECKAIELSPIARVNLADEVLERALRDSIVKSIVQSIDVISSSKESSNRPTTNNNYIFVVTYKELYLGNGEVAWDEFVKESIQKNYPETDISLIEPNKVFFVSIHDFDRLVGVYEGKPEMLFDKLFSITQQKVEPRDRKYVFGMYIDEEAKEARNSYLKKNFDEYFGSWKKRLESQIE